MEKNRSTHYRQLRRIAQSDLHDSDAYDAEASSSDNEVVSGSLSESTDCVNSSAEVSELARCNGDPKQVNEQCPSDEVFSSDGIPDISSFESSSERSDISETTYFSGSTCPSFSSSLSTASLNKIETLASILPLGALGAVAGSDFENKLRKWAVCNNVRKTALRELLHLLKPLVPSIPVHPDTFLKTKAIVGVQKMGKGFYYNFGLKQLLKDILAHDATLSHIHLTVNIDGLPVFKSSTCECWPILCMIDGVSLPPFMSAVWCGQSGKPPLMEYLKEFVSELKYILLNGIVFQGKCAKVTLSKFVCDAPATAFLKGIVGHTGYFGCGKCTVRGYWQGCMTFASVSGPLRTDRSFVAQDQKEHHLCKSPLLNLGMKMVTQFPLDYMHLVCLGVVKRLLIWMIFGKKHVRKRVISNAQVDTISIRMILASKCWPRDFSRTPRALKDVKRWKATEFRQFILYLACSVLHGVVPKQYYNLVVTLHAAIKILCLNNLTSNLIDIAETMLQQFVKDSVVLFGRQFVSYNVHNLLHLANDCRSFGRLDNFSAFVFENELQVVKNAIRGRTKVIQQLINRYEERKRETVLAPRCALLPDGFVLSSVSPSNLGLTRICYKKLVHRNRIISLLPGDGVIALKNGSFIMSTDFLKTSKGSYVIGYEFMQFSNLYDCPIESSALGIFLAGKLSSRKKKWSVECILCKAASVPFKSGGSFVLHRL